MRVDTTIEGDESREEIGAERLRLALLWVFPRVQSHVLEVGRGPWRIGRSTDCKISVDGGRASREHAEIAFDGPVVLVRDLQSTNGTFVDGVRIEQAPVKAGSILRLGSHVGIRREICRGTLVLVVAWAGPVTPRWTSVTSQACLDAISNA